MKHLAWIMASAIPMAAPGNAQNRSFSGPGKAALDGFLAQAVQETYIPGIGAILPMQYWPFYDAGMMAAACELR